MQDEKTTTVTRRKRKTRWESESAFNRRKAKKYYVVRQPRAPVPLRLLTKMKYHTAINLSPVALNETVVHVFSANGTYDPDITGAGHQPRGFDQLMQLYDHNVVIYSEIYVIYPCSVVNSAPYIAHVALEDFTTVADLVSYAERSDSIIKPCSGAQGFPTTITMKRNPNKFLGRSNPLADPDLKNSVTGNANEQANWHVGLTRGSGTDPNSMRVQVTITYTCVFIEPKDPGIS